MILIPLDDSIPGQGGDSTPNPHYYWTGLTGLTGLQALVPWAMRVGV
jgi:hypothetical protein